MHENGTPTEANNLAIVSANGEGGLVQDPSEAPTVVMNAPTVPHEGRRRADTFWNTSHDKGKAEATEITAELNAKGYSRVEKSSYSLNVGVSGEPVIFSKDRAAKEPEIPVQMQSGTAFKIDGNTVQKILLRNVGKYPVYILGEQQKVVQPGGEAEVSAGTEFSPANSSVTFRLETQRESMFPQLYLGIKNVIK